MVCCVLGLQRPKEYSLVSLNIANECSAWPGYRDGGDFVLHLIQVKPFTPRFVISRISILSHHNIRIFTDIYISCKSPTLLLAVSWHSTYMYT